MTLNQMRYFQAAAKYRNYTKAAAVLFVSQPAVSQAIRQLEEECRTPLVIRRGNELSLTEAGNILLAEINPILSKISKLENTVQNDGLARNYVRVGISTFSGNSVFPEVCKNFYDTYPEIRIDLSEDNTVNLLAGLDSGDLDLIITSPGKHLSAEALNSKYGSVAIRSSGLGFFLGKADPRSSRTYFTMAELAHIPIILLNRSYPSARSIIENFESHGVKPNVLLYTSQMYTIERFVSHSAAGGFLPRELAISNNNIVNIPYEGEREAQNVALLWRRNSHLYPAMKKFIEIAEFTAKQMSLMI